MPITEWVNVRLAGVSAVLVGVLFLLLRYSMRISDPWLAKVAGLVALALAATVVADTLHGGLTD